MKAPCCSLEKKKNNKLTAQKYCSISCLTCPLMTWMMGQRVPSASLLKTPNWKEWLIMPEGRAAIHRDLDRLEKWVDKSVKVQQG